MAEKSKKNKSPFWARVRELVSRPSRMKRGMNLSRLSVLTTAGQTVVVADKVLGTGKLAHSLTIGAVSSSHSAKTAVAKAGGKILTLAELESKHPSGKDVVILI
ncbi:MAG: 50S ribosomal protein L18e [Candidatus Micrarchaeota archaeon]